MSETITIKNTDRSPKILLVDDEEMFRAALSKQLEVRGYRILEVSSGEDAIKAVRHKNPEVVILDQKMPGMDGIQTLKEIKKIKPEVQVIMLTGYGTAEKARVTGKLDAFRYLQKPCGLEELIETIDAARQERISAMARHEIPHIKKRYIWQWLIGAHGLRPGIIIFNLLVFCAIAFMPTPRNLMDLITLKKTENKAKDGVLLGYADYRKMAPGEAIYGYYSEKAGYVKKIKLADGTEKKIPLPPKKAAFKTKVMVGILVMCALFWATGAIPVGVTALLACVFMYMFGVLPPDQIAKAHAKDAVLFIFGVLGFAKAISKTGLDRRIGILLLNFSTSLPKFLFIFAPLLSMTAAFLSEHALVAFTIPVLLVGYSGIVKAAGLKQDRSLAVMFILVACFAANVGGPGSPAAGGRNAVMVGILADYGIHISFGQWVKYGMPFVPVMAIVIALYFYLVFRNRLQVKQLDLIGVIRRESERIGKMTRAEYITAAILVILVVLLVTLGEEFGMGGPFLFSLVLLNIFGIIQWKDINDIHWDVVALYASACAMGSILALTGGSLWLADRFVSLLPDYFKSGVGLAISSSLFCGFITNFMSDGATVSAIGPITVPMATISGTSPIMVGLATAFASSFAHALIIGTPNNAIAYVMAKDPETGEQLVTLTDFLKYGVVAVLLSWAVLWGWAFFGYWQWLGF
ncbi:MAG: SLC13 family permease [bacterium]